MRQSVRDDLAKQFIPLVIIWRHFRERMYFTSVLMSASFICDAKTGIGKYPHTPLPPLDILFTSKA